MRRYGDAEFDGRKACGCPGQASKQAGQHRQQCIKTAAHRRWLSDALRASIACRFPFAPAHAVKHSKVTKLDYALAGKQVLMLFQTRAIVMHKPQLQHWGGDGIAKVRLRSWMACTTTI